MLDSVGTGLYRENNVSFRYDCKNGTRKIIRTNIILLANSFSGVYNKLDRYEQANKN